MFLADFRLLYDTYVEPMWMPLGRKRLQLYLPITRNATVPEEYLRSVLLPADPICVGVAAWAFPVEDASCALTAEALA
jgi:hypothetical protein